jgi:hypothetical protein
MQCERKITIGEMRETGPTRLIVYCADYKVRAFRRGRRQSLGR